MKVYITPSLDISAIYAEDIIRTSDNGVETPLYDENDPVYRESSLSLPL